MDGNGFERTLASEGFDQAYGTVQGYDSYLSLCEQVERPWIVPSLSPSPENSEKSDHSTDDSLDASNHTSNGLDGKTNDDFWVIE